MKLSRRVLLAATSAVLMGACGRKAPRGSPVAAGATVLALGDSITFGTGAPAGSGYPEALAQLTGWNVVNAGVPGDVSAGALARLPALLAQHQPSLVLVSIGGNDFLRRLPEADTRAQLRAICEACTAAGAQVLLIGVPKPSLAAAATRSLSDHPMYGDIADALRLPLHGGGWAAVLGDATLRSDPIHANAQGYARFAQGLADGARKAGLLAG
jgi:acyl-CoA hydrolase